MSKGFVVSIDEFNDSCKKAEELLWHIEDGYDAAVLRAMNRAAISGRAAAVATIRQEYTVKASTLRNAIELQKANKHDHEASVYVSGSALSLSNFKVRPTSDTTGKNRKQVRVQVKNDGGLKPLGHFIYRGHVFARLGSARLPFEVKAGPSVPSMANSEIVKKNVEQAMRETFVKRLDHEVLYILDRGNAGLKNHTY